MTSKCDIDLRRRDLGTAIYISSHDWKHLCKLFLNLFIFLVSWINKMDPVVHILPLSVTLPLRIEPLALFPAQSVMSVNTCYLKFPKQFESYRADTQVNGRTDRWRSSFVSGCYQIIPCLRTYRRKRQNISCNDG